MSTNRTLGQINCDLLGVHAKMGEALEILNEFESRESLTEDAKQMAKRGAGCLSEARFTLEQIRKEIQNKEMVTGI